MRTVVGKIEFGPNKNGDAFSIEALKHCSWTFTGKCSKCGTPLEEDPRTHKQHMYMANTFYVPMRDFCPKCSEIKTCKHCGSTVKVDRKRKGARGEMDTRMA